jgi:hypothetical protein
VPIVASIYDFETLGVGSYSFEPVSSFQLFDMDATPNVTRFRYLPVDVASSIVSPISIKITKDVKKRSLPGLEKRAQVSCSNSSRRAFIASA